MIYTLSEEELAATEISAKKLLCIIGNINELSGARKIDAKYIDTLAHARAVIAASKILSLTPYTEDEIQQQKQSNKQLKWPSMFSDLYAAVKYRRGNWRDLSVQLDVPDEMIIINMLQLTEDTFQYLGHIKAVEGKKHKKKLIHGQWKHLVEHRYLLRELCK